MANSSTKPNHPPDAAKIAIVTGAAQRLGRAIAAGLAADGWAVAIHYCRSEGDAQQLRDDIVGAGGTASLFMCDLSSLGGAEQLIRSVCRVMGAPSLLINNAAKFEWDSVEEMTPASWREHFAVNAEAPIFLAKEFAAHLPAGVSGNIINMLDQRVLKLTPRFFSYAMSKSTLWTATRILAQALAPHVRVNAIAPGAALANCRQSAAEFAAQQGATPLKRGTNPDEIYDAVRYILGAPALTGQLLALDGGQHLMWQTPDVEVDI